jgi:hypothetical protein
MTQLKTEEEYSLWSEGEVAEYLKQATQKNPR